MRPRKAHDPKTALDDDLGLRNTEFEEMRKESTEDLPSTDEKWSPVGLAFSGGGIRSASYCLGVMQALAQQGWMRHIDYLSTVSGGGYIGASLSWFLGQEDGRFGTDPTNFPFDTEFGIRRWSQGPDAPVLKAANLKWLRQRGNYLTPGQGQTLPSFLWVILRGAALSAFVHLGVLTLAMWGLRSAGAFQRSEIEWPLDWMWGWPWLLVLSLIPVVLLGLVALSYAGFTFFVWILECVTTSKRAQEWLALRLYGWRRRTETLGGYAVIAAAILFVVGSLPLLAEGPLIPGWEGWQAESGVIGMASVIAGVLTSLGGFRRRRGGSGGRGSVSAGFLLAVASALIVYGLLLLGYWASGQGRPYLVAAGVALVVGWISNLNLVSVHRFYRDRLMETFLPDPDLESYVAEEAEVAPLTKYGSRRPYHLINTNVVLVDSPDPGLRGRGGDSFVLSAAHCGSSATGWESTSTFLGGNLSLPTAMAVSGAAAHPNTGVAGRGPTRGRLLSMLMTFFNIRLGLWVPRPDPDTEPDTKEAALSRRPIRDWFMPPNFFHPGFMSLLRLPPLNENRRWLELTDGGHFENLGIYELVRRRCKVIIACDAGADPGFKFGDLANAVQRIRTDFGVLIDLTGSDLDELVPREHPAEVEGKYPERYGERPRYARRGFLIAPILYPTRAQVDAAPAEEGSGAGGRSRADPKTIPNEEAGEGNPPGDGEASREGEQREDGVFIYLKTTLLPVLPADIYGVTASDPSFPDQSTTDQFFDESQFENYRELGFKMTYSMLISFREQNHAGMTRKEICHLKRALEILERNGKEAQKERSLFEKRAQGDSDPCDDPEPSPGWHIWL